MNRNKRFFSLPLIMTSLAVIIALSLGAVFVDARNGRFAYNDFSPECKKYLFPNILYALKKQNREESSNCQLGTIDEVLIESDQCTVYFNKKCENTVVGASVNIRSIPYICGKDSERM